MTVCSFPLITIKVIDRWLAQIQCIIGGLRIEMRRESIQRIAVVVGAVSLPAPAARRIK